MEQVPCSRDKRGSFASNYGAVEKIYLKNLLGIFIYLCIYPGYKILHALKTRLKITQLEKVRFIK